jgi:hypothetical protein
MLSMDRMGERESVCVWFGGEDSWMFFFFCIQLVRFWRHCGAGGYFCIVYVAILDRGGIGYFGFDSVRE